MGSIIPGMNHTISDSSVRGMGCGIHDFKNVRANSTRLYRLFIAVHSEFEPIEF
jgi:hypothetical protein